MKTTMNPEILCRRLLRVVDSIPSTAPWGAVEWGDDCVFIHDRRDESTTMIMESVAGRFGEVVAVESVPSDRADAGPLLGCLVNVASGADEIAGKLRAAYWTATEPNRDEGSDPF